MSNPIYKIVTNAEDLQKAFFVRGIVFEEGQHTPYDEDFDGQDYAAVHFLVTVDGEPAAAARMRFFDGYVKIERLAVRQQFRGHGIGKTMFNFVINHAKSLGCKRLVIHAQKYLLCFYESFGFVKQGDIFLEANIEHYLMIKN